MTPADRVDPPPSPFHLINQQEDQPQFFISANHASSSLSSPSFCTIIRDQRGARVLEVSRNDHDQDGNQNLHMAGSSNHQIYSTSILPEMDENTSSVCGHNLALHKYKLEEDHISISSSAQWMPSKMRLMHRMMTANKAASEKSIKNFPRLQNQQQHGCSDIINTGSGSSSASNTGNNTNTTRVCSDCNTTTTPLWRSGPRGPKSLCNACGIRQRKQRKAMSEASATAATGLVVPEASSAKIGRIMHSREKKPRSAGAATFASQGDQRQLPFNDLKLSWSNSSASQQLFPQDEVAEAAILLMELSCGFLHV